MSELHHPNPIGTSKGQAVSSTGLRLSQCFDPIDELFSSFFEVHRVPGLVWGVVDQSGLLHVGSRGVPDPSRPDRLTEHHVFRIASMTKSFTAMCILLLRDRAKLSLDDPVQQWLPELKVRYRPHIEPSTLTIAQLLSMSSGLVEDDPWADRQLAMPESDFTALLATGIGLDLPPGSGFEYSNLGYAMLGLIAKRAAGHDLNVLAIEQILQPLQMHASTWNLQDVDATLLATGYRLNQGNWEIEALLDHGAFGAMGGLASSIKDLAQWVALHLGAWHQEPRLSVPWIKRSSLREMAQIHTAISRPNTTHPDLTAQGYGYGLTIAHHRLLGRIVGHSGGLPGYGSRMEWLTDYDIGLVTLANRTYTALSDVVRQGLTHLVETGLVGVTPLPVSEELRRVYEAIIATYQNPQNQAALREVALPSYFLDCDDDRRPPDFGTLRSTHGRLISTDPISAQGSLRGFWTMHCARGALTMHAMLGPGVPHKLQFLGVASEPTAPGNR
ncbi:serine hydrolase [Ferrimicrobium sp.]|uniref:serine hydrolase domain-containing protein n=1 Tax=Ferrimicrobium sp. TaxID=2926050 RepID=UPI00260FF110|nr:serine hydrolase domain-containing protein [Ferrimicrobium sp.]MCL5974142.1 beta-lactamase family protein [Actinomycetota bacterium]